MASTFKPTYTKPLPMEAGLFTRKGQRFARWTERIAARRELADFMRLVREDDRRQSGALDAIGDADVWLGRIADKLDQQPLLRLHLPGLATSKSVEAK